MKSVKNFLIPVILAAMIGMSGCAPDISANSYDAQNIGAVNNVVRGVIVSARPVRVNSNNGVGGVAGAVAGGAAGSLIGGGTQANIIGAVGGAVIGGLLGNQVQKGISAQTGMEYIVKTRKGNLISVVQGAQNYLAVGQHVMVIFGAQPRIIPDTQ